MSDRAERCGRAARAFLGADAALTPLGRSARRFRVDAPAGAFLLRVHAPAEDDPYESPPAVESECAWLAALDRDTDLGAPAPVAAPAGGYVLRDSDGDGEFACTLLTWVDGEHRSADLGPEHAARLGALLAALHDHASSWSRPPGFERPTHAPEACAASLARFRAHAPAAVVAATDPDLLDRVVERVSRALAPAAAEPGRCGLVHGDLHVENVAWAGDAPRPIDFGRCGFGPWLYDLAECVGGLGGDRRRALLDAYAARRPLAEADLRRLDAYQVASLVEVFGHHAPDPAQHGYLARALPAWEPHFRRFDAGEPFAAGARPAPA